VTVLLALVAGVLFAVGTYLVLQRSLVRIIIGLVVLGHGANVLLLFAGGRAGQAPLVEGSGAGAQTVATGGAFADPLPQAFALTAIVISFGVVAFLLALAYRAWLLFRKDEVEDDVEDRRIARLAAQGRLEPADLPSEPSDRSPEAQAEAEAEAEAEPGARAGRRRRARHDDRGMRE
jgi:multicomponent Na+:H+ antiporter subunit C